MSLFYELASAALILLVGAQKVLCLAHTAISKGTTMVSIWIASVIIEKDGREDGLLSTVIDFTTLFWRNNPVITPAGRRARSYPHLCTREFILYTCIDAGLLG